MSGNQKTTLQKNRGTIPAALKVSFTISVADSTEASAWSAGDSAYAWPFEVAHLGKAFDGRLRSKHKAVR